MSYPVFHKGNRQPACGNGVDFLRVPILSSFSTKFRFELFTGFVVEKESDRGAFLAFNNPTKTTIGIY